MRILVVWICSTAILPAIAQAAPQEVASDAVLPDAFQDWGSDHIQEGHPPYVTGDECLFCHRDIGSRWQENPHQLTVRRATPDSPEVIQFAKQHPESEPPEFLLGSEREFRFLRRAKRYGAFEIHSSHLRLAEQLGHASPDRAKHPVSSNDSAPHHWDNRSFGQRCAGCHTTAVGGIEPAFEATSIDCYACHGDVPLGHSNDPSQALLSKERQDPRVVVSLCGQCHLRGGESRSSGRPYPNHFVPGDNLFRDFVVDLSPQAASTMPPPEAHIYENVRQALMGTTGLHCGSCHRIHLADSSAHAELAPVDACYTCHQKNDEFELHAHYRDAHPSDTARVVCDLIPKPDSTESPAPSTRD